jgi:hypothetical protein
LHYIGHRAEKLETATLNSLKRVRWSVVHEIYLDSGYITPNPAKNKSLSNWFNGQRRTFNDGKLSKEKTDILLAIGFDFRQQINSWEQNYQLLINYNKINGHVDVPSRSANLNFSHLGNWVRLQREYKRQGVLRQSRIKTLEFIGFKWDIEPEEKHIHGSVRGYS